MKNHKLWLLSKEPTDEPIEVENIEEGKASIFYFSGVGDFAESKPGFNLRRSLVDVITSGNIDETKYNIYTISSRHNRDPEDLLDSIDKFNKDPNEFDKEGKELFDKIIEKKIPHYADTDTKNANNIKDIKSFFSTLNFIGHSYGAVFLGQINNSICHDMKAKGYNSNEIESCLDSLLGCYIGPSRKLTHSNLDIPSLYAVSSYDPFPEKRGKFSELVNDNHEYLNHKLDSKALVLYSKKSPIYMPVVSFEKKDVPEIKVMPEDNINMEELRKAEEAQRKQEFDIKGKPIANRLVWKKVDGKWKSKEEDLWNVKFQKRDATNPNEAHHPFRYTNNAIKNRNDLHKITFQAEPFAHIVAGLIETQLQSSINSIETKEIRSGISILKEIENTHLTKEGKDNAVKIVQNSMISFNTMEDNFRGR